MNLQVVKVRDMSRLLALSLLLGAAAGCSSGPSSEELTQELFDRIAMKVVVYNGALKKGVLWEIEPLPLKNSVRPAAMADGPL